MAWSGQKVQSCLPGRKKWILRCNAKLPWCLWGVDVVGHVVRIGDVVARCFEPEQIERNDVRCADPQSAAAMVRAIVQVQRAGDSLGGIVEDIATGVPPGCGDPVFRKLDA